LILKFLIIQTAFAGDVVLATPLIEKIQKHYPGSRIDFLLRKGNETLLEGHPFLKHIYIWDKKKSKYPDLFRIISEIRKVKYDHVINTHRFASSGIVSLFSDSKSSSGFSKNPLSFFFKHRYKHSLDEGVHEIERNLSLISHIMENSFERPRLYPSEADRDRILPHLSGGPYICLAPGSVWFTKQLPAKTWVQLIELAKTKYRIYLIGGALDREFCQKIISQSELPEKNNLCGELSYLESAALIEKAEMNFVNDSAPMHIASAMNAAVCAIYCSTIPSFGFRPVSDHSHIVEMMGPLYCRPCGIHGFSSCPEKHFKCGRDIRVDKIFAVMNAVSAG
jgi:ADP-heptose:LPS heptosyltransferase